METCEIYTTVTMACGEGYRYALPTDTLSTSWDIVTDYRNAPNSGHYFDADTLRFFGSRNFETVAQGVTVELQTRAPGDRYKVTTWRNDDNGYPDPWAGCWHATRRQAVACAKATAQALRDIA